MSTDPEAVFRGLVYRVTGEPIVANSESNLATARELHLASCRTLRKYPSDTAALVSLSDADVDQAWIQAIDDDTATDDSATAWPFSSETAWCPRCIVKVLKVASDGSYKHPLARSTKWRPGIPLGCRFPTAHGSGHCGCDAD